MKTLDPTGKSAKNSSETVGGGPLPTRKEAEMALESLRQALASGERKISVEINGQKFEIPSPMEDVLDNSLEILSHGQSVAVSAVDNEMGTSAAAKMLGVSRPHLVKMLDSGEIPSRKVGTHRRVLVEDILNFQNREKAKRKKVLAELAAADQELDLVE